MEIITLFICNLGNGENLGGSGANSSHTHTNGEHLSKFYLSNGETNKVVKLVSRLNR